MNFVESLGILDDALNQLPQKAPQEYIGYLNPTLFNTMCKLKKIKRKRFFRHEGYKFYKAKQWDV